MSFTVTLGVFVKLITYLYVYQIASEKGDLTTAALDYRKRVILFLSLLVRFAFLVQLDSCDGSNEQVRSIHELIG